MVAARLETSLDDSHVYRTQCQLLCLRANHMPVDNTLTYPMYLDRYTLVTARGEGSSSNDELTTLHSYDQSGASYFMRSCDQETIQHGACIANFLFIFISLNMWHHPLISLD